MGDRYDIGVDIGEGKDKAFATLFRIGEDGKYIPVIPTDSLFLSDSIQGDGYVVVDSGVVTFSSEIVPYCQDTLSVLFGWKNVRPLIGCHERCRVLTKRCKTTYKTIRRDCAKRNRHK